MSKYRNFCFTVNNYTDVNIKFLDELKCKYLIYGKEVGESGTPHLQCYVMFKSQRSEKAVRKLLAPWHVEVANGSPMQNFEYCSKDGDFIERGDRPKGTGKRTDLIKVKNRIEEGTSVDSLCMENPMLYHQYGRTLMKLEDIVLRQKTRTWMTKGIWYWGPTGVGKSHKAFEGFSPDTHYVVPDDNGWWDGYTGQETVINNDFRGEWAYNFCLQLTDKWPMRVKRRNREPVPFLAKTVIITSSLAPDQIFKRRFSEDSLDQLYRRFEIIELGSEVVKGNTSNPVSQIASLTTLDSDCSFEGCSYCFLAGKVECKCS